MSPSYSRIANHFYPMIEYPFVLENDRLATLWLPREGLTQQEADRLSTYVQTLVALPKVQETS